MTKLKLFNYEERTKILCKKIKIQNLNLRILPEVSRIPSPVSATTQEKHLTSVVIIIVIILTDQSK